MKLIALGALALVSAAALVPIPANAAEHGLAGIRIFAPVKEVLARYGNPNQVVTNAGGAGAAGAANTGTNGNPYTPSGMPTGMPMGGPMPPMYGGRPGMPGMPMGPGMPGAQGMPVIPGAPAAPGSAPAISVAGEVMYVYDKPNGLTLDFLLSPDGRVIQITALGYKGSVKTLRGVMLGTTYSAILGKYGYPEAQDASSGILSVNYLQKQHVSFQLRNNKVVGITVAAVE